MENTENMPAQRFGARREGQKRMWAAWNAALTASEQGASDAVLKVKLRKLKSEILDWFGNDREAIRKDRAWNIAWEAAEKTTTWRAKYPRT